MAHQKRPGTLGGWEYEIGATRWRRWDNNKGDPRGHRCWPGWKATAEICDNHPITGEPLPRGQWWIRETYVGKDAV